MFTIDKHFNLSPKISIIHKDNNNIWLSLKSIKNNLILSDRESSTVEKILKSKKSKKIKK